MRNSCVPLNIWRNRQGVAETDVAITKFYCNYVQKSDTWNLRLYCPATDLKELRPTVNKYAQCTLTNPVQQAIIKAKTRKERKLLSNIVV
jgi:succinate dehydrogenase flavin-adding protein (antitoxin of CptAB toxin-antitoxin module)